MTEVTCKGTLEDGSPCTNPVDIGQTMCPYHLSTHTNKLKKIFRWLGAGVGVIAIGVIGVKKGRKA